MKTIIAICVVALGSIAFASAAAPTDEIDTGAPVVTTGIAQAGDWFAFLHGTVDPNGQETTAWFEWGRTPELGSVTTAQVVPPGGEVQIADTIFNLESFTQYYFRLVAENATARAFGATLSFGTLDTIPPPPTCRVPNLVGRPLATARSLIRKAGCRAGPVRKARSRRAAGTVVSQVPRGGLRVPLRTHVRLVVSRGRR